MHASEGAVHIDGTADAARTLFLQIVGKIAHHLLAAGDVDVQVFIEHLRGTETFAVSDSEIDVGGRIVTDVQPRAEDGFVDEIVLVEAAARKEAPAVGFPFVLQEPPRRARLLRNRIFTVAAGIFEIAALIFESGRQVGRHEPKAVERMHIQSAHLVSQFGGGAVRIFADGVVFDEDVHAVDFLRAHGGRDGWNIVDVRIARAVVTVAVRMLHGGIQVEFIFLVGRVLLEIQVRAIHIVLELLGDVSLEGLAG